MRRNLLAWYWRERRDLPWRRTDDPYRIWLSETMLQQTRVDTVVPYYERFLARFPDVQALAAADEQDVLREWSGLGYYARARNLKKAAQQIVREHGGHLPRDPELLAALPGIGRYTLGALRSIAFGERAGLVDGNVRRVFARLRADPAPEPETLWALAESLVPKNDPGDFNQALMELGATVCTARAPMCGRCPLRRCCAAHGEGHPEAYPEPRSRKPPPEVRALAGLLERRRPEPAVLMLRRPSAGLLGGLWELPSCEGADANALLRGLAERTGLEASAGEKLGELRHEFSHRSLTLGLLRLERGRGRLRASADGARWCARQKLGELPLSTLMRRALELAGVGEALS